MTLFYKNKYKHYKKLYLTEKAHNNNDNAEMFREKYKYYKRRFLEENKKNEYQALEKKGFTIRKNSEKDSVDKKRKSIELSKTIII